MKEDSFCWGSWIIKDSSPSYVAIESALCIYEFAFNTLGFRQSHFDVRKNNVKVVAFHQRCKARIVREDSRIIILTFLKKILPQCKGIMLNTAIVILLARGL